MKLPILYFNELNVQSVEKTYAKKTTQAEWLSIVHFPPL